MEKGQATRANIKTIVGAVLLAVFIRIVLFEPFEIEGPSMEPTLLNGDRVVVSKFSYGLFLPFASEALISWGEPSIGSVVIVKGFDEEDIVKRVVGLPGDVIEVREHIVFRNGESALVERLGACLDENGDPGTGGCEWVSERLGDTTYQTSRDIGHDMDPVANTEPVTVSAGHVFVMGDHRDRSNDSRTFEELPMSRLKGHALAIYWSSDEEIRGSRIFSGIH